MRVMVTGGAGYIGSHACMELIFAGFEVVVIDNLSNSSVESLRRIEKYTGRRIHFYEGDIRNAELLQRVFEENKIDAVIHFAALKSINESVDAPLIYYDNNIRGTVTLLDAMKRNECKSIVFSSSASVYGVPERNPITEEFPTGGCTNAYARTKIMTEDILRDVYKADESWNVIILRYFNPIGAHSSGIIGEMPNGIPSNLVPYVTQVAIGKLNKLRIFGDDYPTPDGTGVRDYIHVVDLAKAHVRALKVLTGKTDVHIYNLGTGRGYSVLELVHTFEKVTGKRIPYVIKDRRPGDVAICYCDASKAKRELGWEAQYGIEDMCRHAWKWQEMNPNGYEPSE